MAIRRWHWGKLVILWAWGVLIAGIMLTDFLGTPVQSSPYVHLFEFVISLLIFLMTTAVTWRWLSGKELARAKPSRAERDEERTD